MSYFERVYCVTLDRRPDRWEEFERDLPDPWPFPEVRRYAAIDGKLCKHPTWWHQGGGAWGCYKSHVNILEECMNQGVESCLFLEDDAIFCNNFADQFAEFWEHVPKDWDMVYIGGQLLNAGSHPPRRINEHVYKPFNVNRTHGYAVHKRFYKTIYKHLHATDVWRKGHHIDHHFGRLHQSGKYNVFMPKHWLCGQRESHSNIKGKVMPERFWIDAEQYGDTSSPFVMVVGLHSSGSSALAMCMHYLGIHMGNTFAYRPDSGEATDFAKHCEKAMPFPQFPMKQPVHKFKGNVTRWTRGRISEANKRNTIAGAKYPHLCHLGKHVVDALGKENIRIVHINRPLEDSIKSLQQRESGRDPQKIEDLQRFLWDEKHKLLAENDHHTIEYYDLLEDPKTVLKDLLEYLDMKVTDRKLSLACGHINKDKRHV